MSTKNMTREQGRIAVVTGSSSGIGLETALILARNGYITYATMRSPDKDKSIKAAAQNESLPIRVVQLDVTDDSTVKNAIDHITSEAGRIDVLVNSAGYGLGGAFEDLAVEEIKSQHETNLFGLIKVILIEPGFIKTNAVNAIVIAKKAQDPSSPYSELMQKMMANMSEGAKNASDPELVANIIFDAASNPNPHLRYLAGKDAESWAAGKKNMEEPEFYNMIKSLITA